MVARALVLALLAGAVAGGCDSAGPASDAQVVVSAIFETGEPLGSVRLTRTVALGEVYDEATAGLDGAAVRVSLLAPDGTVEAAYPYVDLVEPAGVYLPAPDVRDRVRVLGGRTYRLDAAVPLGGGTRTVTATATAPPPVEVVQGPPESVTYGEGRGPESRIRTSSTAARRAVYVLTTRPLAPARFERVTVDGAARWRSVPDDGTYLPVPIVRTFADCEEEAGGTLLCDEDPTGDFAGGTSPLLNEDGYELLPDGTALVRAPFLAFGFYGPQALSIYSLDDALVDFIETQAVQFTPTTLSPGEIPNVTSNVEGGLGVFGVYAGAAVQTFLREP